MWGGGGKFRHGPLEKSLTEVHERVILPKSQAPNFEASEPGKMQFQTPSHPILVAPSTDKHRAREPRNLTHKLSHESAHENAHGVYTKMSTEMPTKVEALSV